MPAALWRQSQISLTTAEWQARFDLRLGDFIDDKPVAGCPYSLQSNEWFAGRLALPLHWRRGPKTRTLCEIRKGCGTRHWRGNISVDFSIMAIESDYDRCT